MPVQIFFLDDHQVVECGIRDFCDADPEGLSALTAAGASGHSLKQVCGNAMVGVRTRSLRRERRTRLNRYRACLTDDPPDQ